MSICRGVASQGWPALFRMLYHGLLTSAASGKVGSLVASRNRGGPYFRAVGNPNPNPATAEQVIVRDAIATCWDKWSTSLSDAQRRAWNDYSRGVLRSPRLGHPRSVGGRAEFTRANVVRFAAIAMHSSSFAWVENPPTLENWELPPTATPVSIDVYVGASSIDVHFDNSGDWNESNGALVLWHSPQLAHTRTFYKGAMNMLPPIEGPSAEEPVSLSLDFLPDVNKRVAFNYRYLRGDGRMSRLYRVWADSIT